MYVCLCSSLWLHRSVKMGNDTDWQPLVELLIDEPNMKITSSK
jgi:hypothetical protein